MSGVDWKGQQLPPTYFPAGPPPPYTPPVPVFYQQTPVFAPTAVPNVITMQPVPPSGATCVYGTTPKRIVCQQCGSTVITSISHTVGAYTYVGALYVLALGLCLVPFFLDSCKDVVHTCPSCRSQVGIFKRLHCHDESYRKL